MVRELFAVAKAKQFALPAANVTGTNPGNTLLETAYEVNSPIYLNFSNGGAMLFVWDDLNYSRFNLTLRIQ